jgi:anti-sigma B factor antagonist
MQWFVPEFAISRANERGPVGQAAVGSVQRKLKCETTVVEGQPVVHVRGEVTLRTAPQLREVLLAFARHSTGTLRIDLAQVPYMDSSGVGTMVYVKRETERTGRRIVLIGLQPRVRSVFEITHLDKFFTIVQTLDEVPGP